MTENTPLCAWATLYPFPFFDGHMSRFHFLALEDNAAIIVCVQVFVWAYVFRSLNGTAGSYGNSTVHCLRTHQMIFQQLDHFPLPPAVYKRSTFSTSLLTLVVI